MARPTKAPDERRDTRLPELRATAAERAFVEDMAAKAGLPLTEFCRQAILSRRVRPRRAAVDEATLAELNRIGVNLNQIARKLNMDADAPADFPAVLDELQALMARIAADGS